LKTVIERLLFFFFSFLFVLFFTASLKAK